MSGLSFEWTLRAGDLLTFIGGVAIAAAFLYRRGGEDARTGLILKELMRDFSEMKIEFKAFSQTLAKVAVQEVQIGLLMKWYDELRNGIGVVLKDKD